MAVRITRREDWETIRARGRPRFLLMAGVLGRGLPMGLVVALAIEIVTGEPIPDSLLSQRFAFRLALAIAVFSLSGCLSAAMTWRLYEKKFGDGP
jgi:hypothetical protein